MHNIYKIYQKLLSIFKYDTISNIIKLLMSYNEISELPDIKAKSKIDDYQKFYTEWIEIMNYINKYQKTLSCPDINKLVTKFTSFCRGITDEISTLYDPYVLLKNLTENQILKNNVIEKIIKNTIHLKNKDLMWLDNLVKKGYVLKQEIFELLFMNNYGSYSEILEKITVITQTQFMVISRFQNIDPKILCDVLKRCNNLKIKELFINNQNYTNNVNVVNQLYADNPNNIIDILSDIYDVTIFYDFIFINEMIEKKILYDINQLVINYDQSSVNQLRYQILFNNVMYIHDLLQI